MKSRGAFYMVMAGELAVLSISTLAVFLTLVWGAAQPDPGQLILWTREGGSQSIQLVDAGRLLRSQVMGAPLFQIVGAPLLSHQGRLVAFETLVDGELGIAVTDWNNRPFYVTDPAVSDRLPAWSPNGEQVALWSNRDGLWNFYLMNSDGSDALRLTDNVTVMPYDHPIWSPDGSKIALRFWAIRSGTGTFVIDLKGGELGSVAQHLESTGDMAWSPDSSQIVYRSARSSNSELYLLDMDSRTSRNLTNNPDADFQPDWSPTGEQIAFVSNRSGIGEVYVMNVDGSAVRQLSSGGAWHPLWSPDGRRIVFISRQRGNNAIYVVDADGGNLRRVADFDGRNMLLGWLSRPARQR